MPRPKGDQEGVMATTQLTLAGVYAQALLDQTHDDDEARRIGSELKELVRLLDSVEGFEKLLTAALLSVRERCELVARIFHGRVAEAVEAFLAVLAKRSRLHLIRPAAAEFPKLLGQRQGKIRVTVTTATELDDKRREDLVEQLRRTFDTEPILTLRIDPTILGGAVVQTGDEVYDSSVAGELKRFSQRLTERIALPDTGADPSRR